MMPANRALLRAAADGDSHRVRALLVQGTEVNSTNGAGQTALMLAAAFNRQEVVNLLLKARANIEVQDDLGLTALDWAAHFPAIVELISKGMQRPLPAPEGGAKTSVPQTNASIAATAAPPAPDSNADNERPALKGLSGAILRDRKPVVVNEVQSATPVAEPLIATEAISNQLADRRAVVPLSTDDTVDQTLGGPKQTASDETAPGSRGISHGRLFDLSPQPSKPLSKVQVSLPEPKAQRSWKRAFFWILPVLFVGALLFGSYQLVTYVLEKTRTTPTQPQAAKPVQNALRATLPSSPPVVSAELAGTELYLPDVEYPNDVEPGQAAKVVVKVHVSAKGIVVGANAIEGDERFRATAEKTAKSSAFSPDKLQGKGSFIDGTITYSFAAKPATQVSPPTGNSQGKVSATAGGPLSGAALSLALPDYSRSARSEGAIGNVTVVVRVSRSGNVKSWRALDGDVRLRAAIINAARRSRFSPDKLPGTGDVVGTITYTFQ